MVNIEVSGIDKLIKKVKKFEDGIIPKQREFLERLAKVGVRTAQDVYFDFDDKYDGIVGIMCNARWEDENTIVVTADGFDVLFIEFGSGATYGGGHELAGQFGYGPSTWSLGPKGKGHWDDPKGWYYKHGEKSLGNPPARGMYYASKEMRAQLLDIAKEVFLSD